MIVNTPLEYGAGLLAYGLAQADADHVQLKVGRTGEVVITIRRGGKIVRTGRVPRNSSMVRWAESDRRLTAET
jgi:hypothetical protein